MVMAELALDLAPPAGRLRIMTTSQAVDLYLGELARQGRTPRTLASYQRTLNKLADEYPQHDVEELTATHLRRFLDGYRFNRKSGKGQNRPATIAQAVTIVRCFFKWLHEEELIAHDPAARIRRPKLQSAHENDNVVTVSSEDVRLLLMEARDWPERIAIGLAVYTGARRHALAQARRSDYDPFDKTIKFHEKGGKTIIKPVADPLAELLDAAIFAGVYEDGVGASAEAEPAADPYLIPGDAQQRRTGQRDDRIVSRLIYRVADRAGVKTTVHALRAAFAVHYLDTMGAENMLALQQLLGHARPETTGVYLRRYERAKNMETVRGMSWGLDSTKLLEANALAEKEGFEPSKDTKPLPERDGIHCGSRMYE